MTAQSHGAFFLRQLEALIASFNVTAVVLIRLFL